MFTILTRFAQLKEVFLSMCSNLHHSPSLYQAGNFLPTFAVKLESLDESQVLLSCPTS